MAQQCMRTEALLAARMRPRTFVPGNTLFAQRAVLCWRGDGAQLSDLLSGRLRHRVASDAETGDTWAGATEALKNSWLPVFVLESG